MQQPYCQHCKTIYNLLPKPISINSHICRQCQRERIRKYREKLNGKIKTREAIKASISRYPHKQKARAALQRALKAGFIHKPLTCTNCRLIKSLDAHHEDYSEALDVLWLCRQCHADLHRTHKLVG